MTDGIKFSVRLTKFSNGERYPLLINSHGIPLWYPTLFTTTQVRNVSKAPNTIMAVLSALRVLIVWAQTNDIDLESRFAQRQFLNEQELESLYYYSQIKSSESENQKIKFIHGAQKQESARGRLQSSEKRVSGTTQYIRLSYMAEYLEWCAIRMIERDAKHVDRSTLDRIRQMTKSLRMRRPLKTRSSAIFARRGLTESQQDLLFEVVRPSSEKNPFSPELQVRNQLIVLLLYYLGLRAGELLALRVSDFDLQQNTLLVARRHDNPNDPRAYQPVVKTADRRIPLNASLVKLVSDYVLKTRSKFSAAKRHHFLFITHKSGSFEGQPLSLKGLVKMFHEIQRAAPELGELTPHILRHTANDRFSALMDQKGAGAAEEEKLRSYLMGWKEGSGTAATYTRRHVENKAKEVALKLQSRMFKNEND